MSPEKKNLFGSTDVSRETFEKLRGYESLIKTWQKKINLVSRETLDDLWCRHILDSAQLSLYINKKESVVLDLGSGAGLPGVVLSILGFENITLVESNKKKTSFLKEVRRKLQLSYNVYEGRIEDLRDMKVDIVTSRALASLGDLLNYSYKFTTEKTKLVFHKGKSNAAEIDAAKQSWGFEVDSKPSITSAEGAVLILSGLCQKK